MSTQLFNENKNLIYDTYLHYNSNFDFLNTQVNTASEFIVTEYTPLSSVIFNENNLEFDVFLSDYTVTSLDHNNPSHFLLKINKNLITVDTDIYNDIQEFFYKYQLYDDFYNDISKITNSNYVTTFINYFDVTDIKNYNEANLQNDYLELLKLKENSNFKLYLYVYKEIFLILLYKKIYDVYITFYTNNNTKTEIKNGLDSIKVAIQHKLQINLQHNLYYITVIKNNNKLTLTQDTNNSSSISLYNTITPEYHVIQEISSNKYFEIPEQIIINNSNEYIFDKKLFFLKNNIEYKIITKNNIYYESKHDDKIKQIKTTNKNINDNKIIFSNEKYYLKSINNNYIDNLYKFTFFIIFIVIIGIISIKSDQSRKNHVFILLIITVIVYSIILVFLNSTTENQESFESSSDVKNECNNLILALLISIKTTAPKIGMNSLYDKFGKIIHKDIKNTYLYNKYLENNIDILSSNKNISWHEIFKKTLFIHTVFIIIIVILIYLWLYSIIPDYNIYLLTITIIFCMILLFNYFRNIHRVLRTKYNRYYWPNITITK